MDKDKKIGSHVRGSILRSKVNKKKNVNPKIMKGAAFIGGAFAVGGTASQAYKAFAAEENNDGKDLNTASNLDNALDKYAESYANQTPSESYSEAESLSTSNSTALSGVSSQAALLNSLWGEDDYMSRLMGHADSTLNVGNVLSESYSDLDNSLSIYSEQGSISEYESLSQEGFSLSEKNSTNISNGVWELAQTKDSIDSQKIIFSESASGMNDIQTSMESSTADSFQSVSETSTSNSESTSISDSTVASESDSISSSESMASESQAGGGTTNPQTGDSNAALILGAAGLGAAGLAGAMAKKKNEK